MLHCHGYYIHGTFSSKEVGGFKVTVWREAEERDTTKSNGGDFYSVRITYLFQTLWRKKS